MYQTVLIAQSFRSIYLLRRAVFDAVFQPIDAATAAGLQDAAFQLSAAVGTDHSRTFLLRRGDAAVSYLGGMKSPLETF